MNVEVHSPTMFPISGGPDRSVHLRHSQTVKNNSSIEQTVVDVTTCAPLGANLCHDKSSRTTFQ